MIALIDGDSIAFILGWYNKDHQDIPTMYKAVDDFLENIFIMTGAEMYYGAIGTSHCKGLVASQSFRYDIYNVKRYKENRSVAQEHMTFWRPIVLNYLVDQWKFDVAFHSNVKFGTDGTFHTGTILEADDLIYTVHKELVKTSNDGEFIICSPDKDLRQISGLHYNYSKGVEQPTFHVDIFQADYNFFKLMLEGDDADNIAGIPGFGPKKAGDKLLPLLQQQADRTSYEELVRSLYHRHFGKYYGDIIYAETEKTISLVWDQQRKIEIHSVPKKPHPFEIESN